MLSSTDVKGVQAIIPTPALEGADRWDAVDTVDLVETERLVNALIADGVDGLLTLGTTGECATLTESEFRAFADCVVSTVDHRIPLFVGATTLGTHETISRLRFIRDLGADGTMLGMPMWQPLTEEMAVKYYASISEALPDLAIMIYANPRAFRFDFDASFWAKVVEVAPTIVAAKMGPPTGYVEILEAVRGRVNLVPADMGVQTHLDLSADDVTAVWSTGASMGPQLPIALMRAIEAKDWDRVSEVFADIGTATATFMPPNREDFAFYNIQLEKIRMTASGYCNAGPIRPPYDVVPEEFAERARASGRQWAELCKKY